MVKNLEINKDYFILKAVRHNYVFISAAIGNLNYFQHSFGKVLALTLIDLYYNRYQIYSYLCNIKLKTFRKAILSVILTARKTELLIITTTLFMYA